MRSLFISFIASLIFFGLFVYLFDNLPLIKDQGYKYVETEYGVKSQSEFVKLFNYSREAGLIFKIIDKGNFVAMLITVTLAIGSTFLTLHLFIDKMFFKEYYKDPDFGLAFRRSIMFALLAMTFILMRVLAYLDVLTASFVAFFFLLVEALFIGARRNRNLKEEKLVQNKVESDENIQTAN